MRVADGHIVAIEFTLKDEDGSVIETTQGKEPIVFTMGDSRMLPGIAAVILGMEVGASKDGELAPGELVPPQKSAATRVLLSEFPEGSDPKVGDRFEAKDAAGNDVNFEVFERDDEAVRIWPLHPLHDKRLGYSVEVVSARRPDLPPPTPGGASFPTLEVELIEE